MRLSSNWQDDSTNLRWTDEIQEQEVIYKSFVELKQVVLGVVDIDLLENLEIFKEVGLSWSAIYEIMLLLQDS